MPPPPAWPRLDDTRLLDQRFCDLKLAVEGPLRARVDHVYAELAARGLTRLRPHVWLSTEWFSPDGVPGIALPFYLAQPASDPKLERSADAQPLKAAPKPRPACASSATKRATASTPRIACTAANATANSSAASTATLTPRPTSPAPTRGSYVTHLARLVRPGPPGRGLRRDVRRLARQRASRGGAFTLPRLASAAQTRIRR